MSRPWGCGGGQPGSLQGPLGGVPRGVSCPRGSGGQPGRLQGPLGCVVLLSGLQGGSQGICRGPWGVSCPWGCGGAARASAGAPGGVFGGCLALGALGGRQGVCRAGLPGPNTHRPLRPEVQDTGLSQGQRTAAFLTCAQVTFPGGMGRERPRSAVSPLVGPPAGILCNMATCSGVPPSNRTPQLWGGGGNLGLLT